MNFEAKKTETRGEEENMTELQHELTGLETASRGMQSEKFGKKTGRRAALLGIALAALFVGTEKAKARDVEGIIYSGTNIAERIVIMKQQRDMMKIQQRQMEASIHMQEEQQKAALEQQKAQQEASERYLEQQGKEQTRMQKEQAKQQFCSSLLNNPDLVAKPEMKGAVKRCTDYLFEEERSEPAKPAKEKR
jgi:phage-related minor tail protein